MPVYQITAKVTLIVVAVDNDHLAQIITKVGAQLRGDDEVLNPETVEDVQVDPPVLHPRFVDGEGR